MRYAWATLLLLAGCSSPPPPPPPPMRLVHAPAPGSAWVRDFQENIDGHLSVRSGQRQETYPLVKEERRVVEDQVLESDGRHVVRLRRKTLSWELLRRAPGDPAPAAVPMALVGRSVEMRRTDLGTEIDGAEGASADELRANSLESLEAILSLPDREIVLGDTWPVDGDRVARVFGGEGTRGIKVREARGTARFEEFGGRTAVVSVRCEVEGGLRSLLDVDVRMSFEASFQINVDAKSVSSMNVIASGTLSGDVIRDGKTSVYDGAFRLVMKGLSQPR